MRWMVPILAVAAVSCSDRERPNTGTFESIPPIPSRPIPTDTGGLDVSTDLAVPTPTCWLTARFDGAIEGTREYPGGAGGRCDVERDDGLIRMVSTNTDVDEQFTVAIRIAGRGSTEVLSADSGPTLEVLADETTTWTGVGEDCDFEIVSHTTIATGYRLVGNGDCFGTIDPAPGSAISRSIRFREFSFEAEFAWP